MDIKGLFGISLFVYGIAYATGPPACTSLCEICGVQRGVGAQISRAAMRGKDKRRLIYMQILQVRRCHLAIEACGAFLPPNTLEARQNLAG